MEYILIFIAAVFVNNVVLSQFLGICPFLGVSKKVSTAIGMTGALTFVMILATLVTFIIQKSVLDPFGIGFMQTITFILVIAALVQMVEIILKKVSPSLYQARCLCRFHCHRFWLRPDHFCRHPRTLGTGGYPQRHAGSPHRPHHRQHPGDGVHGLFWHGIHLIHSRKIKKGNASSGCIPFFSKSSVAPLLPDSCPSSPLYALRPFLNPPPVPHGMPDIGTTKR